MATIIITKFIARGNIVYYLLQTVLSHGESVVSHRESVGMNRV